MTNWDGQERRSNSLDHDSLIKLIEMVQNIDRKMDSHSEIVASHFKDDKEDFEKVHKRINKLTWYTVWYAAIGTGVFAGLEFFKEKIFR